jgi:DNA-3-methyladenine glycosylase II
MRLIKSRADVEEGLRHLLDQDARLLPIAGAAGPLPLRLIEPGFAGLASIVVSQMISRASAQAIWQRILAAGPVTAASYGALSPPVIAGFGLSRAKASTLSGLAHAVTEGVIDLQALAELEADEAIGQLIRLPGIGPWTAEVYLMFCTGHPDIFPAGDIALQAAVTRAFNLEARPSAKELKQISMKWAPHRAIAARLFWAYYAHITQRQIVPVS